MSAGSPRSLAATGRLAGLLAGLPAMMTVTGIARADDGAVPMLSYVTIQPAHIRMGESALLRVTSLGGYLPNYQLPDVPGLTFQLLGRTQGAEILSGKSFPATYIMIKVTPQNAGVFTIPGPTAKSLSVGLDVLGKEESDPYVFHPGELPKPLPVTPAALPAGIRLQAGGAVFVELVIPAHTVYVGQSVPVDIEVGVRPGLVTSMNGLPTLKSDAFTLNNLSRHPKRTEQPIDGKPFVVMTWHSVLAPIKQGDFSLSVEMPLSVKVSSHSSEDLDFASKLGWPFLQSAYKSIPLKELKIQSPASALKVLALPTEGQPKDFSGAVGEFQVASEVSPADAGAGDPLTLRLHVSGSGNFDRVDSPMLEHLDQWKTYPAKSAFTAGDEIGYKGEKVFEQPLIAATVGEHVIPSIAFSYFNPRTQQYERVSTPPLPVRIGTALAERAPGSRGAAGPLAARDLRPDHPQPGGSVSSLAPLYFQTPFLAVPGVLALMLAGGWIVIRPASAHTLSRSAERALAQLAEAARAGDAARFFEGARAALLPVLAARWRMSPGQITAAELKARLGSAGAELEQLWALADESKYAPPEAGSTDFTGWLARIRGHLLQQEG